MTYRAKRMIGAKAGLFFLAPLLFVFPLEVLQIVAWTWIAAVGVLLIILAAALVVRLILRYADPELYRLVTDKKDNLTGRRPPLFDDRFSSHDASQHRGIVSRQIV